MLSKGAACSGGVGHPRYDPRQHPTDLLPPPWLVLLEGTLPGAPWPLPARTPQPVLPHLCPLWRHWGAIWCIPSLVPTMTDVLDPGGARAHPGAGAVAWLAARGCLMVSLPQGLAVLVLFCVLNEEVREAWKLACLGKKGHSEEATRSTQVGESKSCPGAGNRLADGNGPASRDAAAPPSQGTCPVSSPCLARAPVPTTTQRCSRRAGSSASPWGPPPSPR